MAFDFLGEASTALLLAPLARPGIAPERPRLPLVAGAARRLARGDGGDGRRGADGGGGPQRAASRNSSSHRHHPLPQLRRLERMHTQVAAGGVTQLRYLRYLDERSSTASLGFRVDAGKTVVDGKLDTLPMPPGVTLDGLREEADVATAISIFLQQDADLAAACRLKVQQSSSLACPLLILLPWPPLPTLPRPPFLLPWLPPTLCCPPSLPSLFTPSSSSLALPSSRSRPSSPHSSALSSSRNTPSFAPPCSSCTTTPTAARCR